jgi:excisionase family DNA binding protein
MTQKQAHTAGYAEGRRLLLVPEVARRLGCSRSTVYRLLADGHLQPVYIDSRPRFEAEDIEELVAVRRGAAS